MKRWQSRYNPQCKLSQQDLLEISEEITQAYVPHDIHHSSELVLMSVDPINLYAYWNLQESQTDKQLALRIYSLPELSEHFSSIKLCFDVSVQGLQNLQRIQLPAAASAYSAVIGEINADSSFSALASSDTIHVPRERPLPNDHEKPQQTSQVQNDNASARHLPCENSVAETMINHCKKTATGRQTIENDVHTENIWYEALTLENFKGYGYDLKIYESEPNSETENILSAQQYTSQTDSKIIRATGKNTSGLGRLLECL